MPGYRNLLVLFLVCFVGACSQNNDNLNTKKRINVNDWVLHTNIYQVLHHLDRSTCKNMDILVTKGRCLLLGSLKDESQHKLFIKKIWDIKGVHDVIDHTTIDKTPSQTLRIKDTLAKANVNAVLALSRNVSLGNYNYTVFKGDLYVIALPYDSDIKTPFMEAIKRAPEIKKVFYYEVIAP